MSATGTIRIDGVHNEAALIRLGAWRIGDIYDDAGVLTAHEVEPAIDMDGYAAALAAVRAESLARYAADRRWRAENAGASFGDLPVRTDRDTRSALLEARAALDMDPEWSTPWALPDGRVLLVDASNLPGIIAAVAAHRRRAFETYALVKAGIDAGTITEPLEIDQAGWPG